MKLSRVFVITVLSTLLTSCFKDEPLNAECDIEAAWVNVDNPEKVFFNISDTLVNVPSESNNIVFTIRAQADLTSMAPYFKLTEGATIEPANGSAHDFSGQKQVEYTVTSQDKAWSRTYLVSFAPPKITLKYDFENYKLYTEPNYGIINYYTWQEIANDGSTLDIWATGNPGFSIPNGKAQPEEYPTVPLLQGFDGAGVKLETRSTGKWGETYQKRIAAGNLFLGVFDTDKVILTPLKSTRFGIRFNKEPRTLKGYYKYAPGDTYKDKDGNVVEDRRDSAAIYSVLYRNHDDEGNEVMLFGDDVMTNPNIVAIARLWNVEYTDQWTAFEIPYSYFKPIDYSLLEEYGYNIAIVFSSSKEGNDFEGAVGSTLCIDKVSIECIE